MFVTLLDHYRQDLSGLNVKEAQRVKALWHEAAKRYLNLWWNITSDPVKQYPEPDENGDFEDHVRPVDAAPCGVRFFISRPRRELEDLYKATKPKKASVNK